MLLDGAGRPDGRRTLGTGLYVLRVLTYMANVDGLDAQLHIT